MLSQVLAQLQTGSDRENWQNLAFSAKETVDFDFLSAPPTKVKKLDAPSPPCAFVSG